MRVLQVTTHVNIGGIANYILTLSGSLRSKGADVIVASSGGNLEEEFLSRGIPHRYLNIKTKFEFGPKAIFSAFKLARIIRDENVDIVHAHTRVSQVAASLASRMTGVPYVTTCHGYFKVRSRKVLDTWGVKVIAISDAVQDHLKRDLGVPQERISLIYSGVETGKFAKVYTEGMKKDIRKELDLKDGPIIGTIGRLSQVKGQRYLVQAMSDIIGRKKDAQCFIVGDGDEKFALENLVRALNLKDSVHFVSSNVDTAKFLSIMDIFVFPSVKEGLGIALLEAMAAGKACIASNIGGISDIIKDTSCGILVPVGDINSIGNAVVMLLDNGSLRQKMGENARKQACEKFSLDVMGDKVIQLFKEVLSAKK